MEIIKTQDLSFAYPDSDRKALHGISLSVNSGEFITVCGKSGCGKSTLLRHLKPVLAPYGEVSGSVLFEGRDIKNLTHREQSEKIGFVMQSPDAQIVTDKVWHELAFGLESLGLDNDDIRSRVAEMSSFFGIEGWFHKDTSELSGGQKQLLNLASVMVMQPKVLLLDEPTGQLDPIAAREFLETLSKLNRELGTTVILTEHRLQEAFPVSDRVVVMDEGAIVANGTPREVGGVLNNIGHPMIAALPTPMRVHFAVPNEGECPVTIREGRQWLENMSQKIDFDTDMIADNPRVYAEDIVTLDNVWFRYDTNSPDVVRGLSMNVKKGELYAILGGNGAGKTTALSIISSHLEPYRGKVEVNGNLATLPQNPQVLFTQKTVGQDLAEMGEDISEVVELCELCDLLHKHPYDLSGGEQQRAALAKVLLTNPDILLLDEPTKGFDAHFKEKFAGILSALKNSGATIIMVSHDIEFCAEYADRCAMFFDGRIVSNGAPREFFSGKRFYTTAANRMAHNIIPDAILAEDIIRACGGKIYRREEIPHKPVSGGIDIKEPSPQRKSNIISGIVFFALFVAVHMGFVDKYYGWLNVLLQILSMVLLGVSIVSFLPQKILVDKISDIPSPKGKLTKRTLAAAMMTLIAIPITIYIGIYHLGDRKYFFISLLIILETLLPFVLMFERRRPQARELVVISVLCAMAVAGRQAFFMLPQFKPVLALVIISGVCFGGESGFLVGAVTAFVSNFFSAQGPWTPWQMFAMGIIGFFAGVIFQKGILQKTRANLCIFGAIAAIGVYGGIMNPASVLMWNPTPTADLILSSFVLGFSFDVIHAASTVFFLWLISPAMIDKLDRIKKKYGLIE